MEEGQGHAGLDQLVAQLENTGQVSGQASILVLRGEPPFLLCSGRPLPCLAVLLLPWREGGISLPQYLLPIFSLLKPRLRPEQGR